jgi:hypothetical protein
MLAAGALAVFAALAGLTAWLEAGLARHGSPMVAEWLLTWRGHRHADPTGS